MEEISQREKKFVENKIVGALLFNVFGIMGVFYSIWQHNWNSAVWCLLLKISCTLLLVFSVRYLKSSLHLIYSATFFRFMKYTAVVLAVCSLCAFAAYIAVGVVRSEDFDARSHYAAAPIAAMAGFWYLILFCDARKYEMLLE